MVPEGTLASAFPRALAGFSRQLTLERLLLSFSLPFIYLCLSGRSIRVESGSSKKSLRR